MSEIYPPFPKPVPTIDDAAFWEASSRHELVVQRCGNCGIFRHPPRPVCHDCHSFDVEWYEVPGTGTLYSWTTSYYEAAPRYADHVPYSVGAVRLDGTDAEDILFITHLVDVDPAALEFELPVSVTWEDIEDDMSLPHFAPV